MPEFSLKGDFATAVTDIAEQYTQAATARREHARTIAA
jgi:hypothetical protein